MVSCWLVPGKCLDVQLQFSIDFEKLSICEMILNFSNLQDLTQARHRLMFLQREILLGCQSAYHATKILELKGLDSNGKIALIQKRLIRLVKRFPDMFSYDLFEEMQYFLITVKQQFKEVRRVLDLSRLITTLYHFRIVLEKSITEQLKKRHVKVKYRILSLHTPYGIKKVLSICVGLNYMKEYEFFEERHFFLALIHLISGIRVVPGSYFPSKGRKGTCIFYIEIEKDNNEFFTNKELETLKTGLEKEVKSRIERLVPLVFMPRNEEEVMRNILLLSQQLKYIHDPPQVTVSFDKQSENNLSFTVVAVRVLGKNSLQIKKLIQKSPLAENAFLEKIKIVGFLRRRYPKEACVLRVCLKLKSFLREDFSVDLLKARMTLINHLEKIFGEVRDFNGGMIIKQTENYQQLQWILEKTAVKHPLLLQNFFYSLCPASMSSTLDVSYLKTLFMIVVDAVESNRDEAYYTFFKENKALFVLVKVFDLSKRNQLTNRIEALNILSNELCTVNIQVFDAFYTGFIYLNRDNHHQETFLEVFTSLTFAENFSYL